MRNPTHWVMDWETLSNCSVVVFEDYKTDDIKIFVIHDLVNNFEELITFLTENKKNQEMHISFNGLEFDSQVTEFIFKNKKSLSELSGCEIASRIYQEAQDVIERKKRGEWSKYPEYKLSFPQLDVFKLNHWDNVAKMSSLKWIQFSIDWKNLLEMPIHHSSTISTLEEIEQIVEYCRNDVSSTKQIMYLSKDQINLRKDLTQEYKINLYNSSEPSISKKLFLLFLEQKTGISQKELKEMRTFRDKIEVKDILLPYINFKTKEFQDLLQAYQNLTIDPDKIKGAFKYILKHKNVKTEYGLGGIHGAIDNGIYESKDEMIILSVDVKSFYPNLAIKNKWAPEHLPKEVFCEQYEWFYNERVKIPKKDPKNYVYKIILNSTYGLSIDKNSFLYDALLGMSITINGQMLLSMLYEELSLNIPGSLPLMQNTDGLEMMIPVEYVDKFYDICKQWEKLTQLELEYETYQKMFIRDVNNYIAVTKYKEVNKEKYEETKKAIPYDLYKEENGKFYVASTKCKGEFEFDKLAYHKNKSYLVIRKAIFNYLIHDILPEKYLESNKNIFDYCAGSKIKGNWHFTAVSIKDGAYTEEKLQDTIRFYISNTGCKILKRHNTDGREIQEQAGKWEQTVYNYAEEKPWEEYDINYSFYLNQIYEGIADITKDTRKGEQLTMNLWD
jgi:hypothetical protein